MRKRIARALRALAGRLDAGPGAVVVAAPIRITLNSKLLREEVIRYALKKRGDGPGSYVSG
jgi:hypothetical protein